MKKTTLSLLAIALTMGLISTYGNEQGSKSIAQSKFRYTGNSYTFTGSRSEAANFFGCNTGNCLCAAAYTTGALHTRVPSQDLYYECD